MQLGSLFMVKVYVCYTMTCIGLCDIWVRMTHDLYGDLGIESRQYGQQGYGVTVELTWDVVLIALGDCCRSDDH